MTGNSRECPGMAGSGGAIPGISGSGREYPGVPGNAGERPVLPDRADLAEGRDTTERLSADDQATQRSEQFLAAALFRQRRDAAADRRQPGVCASCGEQCLPLAVYCDDDCRQEHERRQAILRRQGLAR